MMKPPQDITVVVRNALDEDIRDGDITAQLIPADTNGVASVMCRESAILCGTAWFERTFHCLDSSCSITWNKGDGDQLEANEMVCKLEGPARALVTGERTALNFLLFG